MTLELLTVDMFADKIGQPFVMEEPGVPAIELTLTEATAARPQSGAPRACFSLLFTCRGSTLLPQRMYALRHSTLGLRSIFLVPIAQNGDTVTYEAIFN